MKLGRQDHSQVGVPSSFLGCECDVTGENDRDARRTRVRGEAGQTMRTPGVSFRPRTSPQVSAGCGSKLTPLGCGLRLSRWLVN